MEERQRPSRADSLRLTRMPEVRPQHRPATPSPEPPPSAPPPGRKSRRGWWLAAGLVVVVALGAGLAVAYRATTDATIPARGIPPVDIPTEAAAAGSVAASRPVVPPSPVAVPADSVPLASPGVVTKGASPEVSGQARFRANLALTATVTASSVERSGWAARYAADGDPASRWSSGFAEPQWLRADLGARRAVNEVTLVWEHAYAIGYRVETSLDGRKWRTIWSTTAGEGGTVRVKADGVVARYVRMYGTKRSNQYGFSLFEMEIR
ncbi:discoidin domain-containing protein [Actinoplanes sp. M2I2]|uniref:discoidin domain-containing protein n=1 Tax=Actinoplanes sp. M2I2 TaxID=1734444 RepID=UPI002021A1DC|nr:discoidin domain-containing protein [Actinoplanes sp. M2I2]